MELGQVSLYMLLPRLAQAFGHLCPTMMGMVAQGFGHGCPSFWSHVPMYVVMATHVRGYE